MGSVTGIILIGFALGASGYTASSKLILTVIGLALQTPLVLYALKRKGAAKKAAGTPDKKMFVLSALLLTVNCGLLIPSAVIKASPQEFVDIFHYNNPLWYVASSFCLALGTFLIWFSVFYWLASREGKIFFEKIVWIACGVSIVDYMFFGTDLGTLSATLRFDQDFHYSKIQILENIGLLVVLAIVMMSNDTTHNITLLQEPEYEPDMKVDNTRFDEENQNRFTVDGKTMNMTESLQYQHYDCDMASMIQLGKWFDYLRENHLYDNTRIILVSDHARQVSLGKYISRRRTL